MRKSLEGFKRRFEKSEESANFKIDQLGVSSLRSRKKKNEGFIEPKKSVRPQQVYQHTYRKITGEKRENSKNT